MKKEILKEVLEKMLVARRFEEKLLELYDKGLIYGTMHLGIGEESATVCPVLALEKDDYVFATHRCHCQIIGKGVSINKMMSEMLGKKGGLAGGKGGSMHLSDVEKGVLVSNGIVGANIPLACGSALSSKKLKDGKVTLCFLGDGAINIGSVHEGFNLASLWNLPIIFCLVNNGYGMSTPITKARKCSNLEKMAFPYNMKHYKIDGNNPILVYETIKSARNFATKNGPVLIILNTYRLSGHSKSDTNSYRSDDELDYWRKNCPIQKYKKSLFKSKLISKSEINEIEQKAQKIVDDAVEFALNDIPPDIDELETHIFKGGTI